jgi:hypothetical protein
MRIQHGLAEASMRWTTVVGLFITATLALLAAPVVRGDAFLASSSSSSSSRAAFVATPSSKKTTLSSHHQGPTAVPTLLHDPALLLRRGGAATVASVAEEDEEEEEEEDEEEEENSITSPAEVDDDEEEDDDIVQKNVMDASLAAAALKSTQKAKSKAQSTKTSTAKKTMSAKLAEPKKKAITKRKGSLLKLLRVPYIIRVCLNPFTVASMTKHYWLSFFSLEYPPKVSIILYGMDALSGPMPWVLFILFDYYKFLTALRWLGNILAVKGRVTRFALRAGC